MTDVLENEKEYGECDEEQLTIRLSTKLIPEQQGITLLHEIIHAIFGMVDYEPSGTEKKYSEEEVCEMLDTPLWSVLKNNKNILKILQIK